MVEQYREVVRNTKEELDDAQEKLRAHTTELAHQLATREDIGSFSFSHNYGEWWIHPNFFRFLASFRQQGSWPRVTYVRYDFNQGVITSTICQNRHRRGPIVDVPRTTQEISINDIDFSIFTVDELVRAASAMEKAQENPVNTPTPTQ